MIDVLSEVCGCGFALHCIRMIRLTRVQTFQKRAAEIADHAHNPRGALSEGAGFLRGLDETERHREFDVASYSWAG